MNSFSNKNLFFLLFVMLLSLLGCKKSGVGHTPDKDSISSFRIVGYLHVQNDLITAVKQIDLSKITDLNIAFVNPDASGNFIQEEDLATVAKLAHQAHVKIFASIGGGGAPAYFHDLLKPDQQSYFIKNMVNLAVQNDLDGIDVDLEGALIDQNYESFVINLATALRNKNKMITAAIATVYANSLSDKALAQFDFINIMSYDKTGPWAPSNPGQHSPYSMAINDLQFWTGTRSIPKDKLNLGIPFYGYGFGPGAPQSMAFRQIAIDFPGSVNLDQVSFPGGGILYYNGLLTVKKKALLASENAGGIMIWELSQDATGASSLLNTINKTIHTQQDH